MTSDNATNNDKMVRSLLALAPSFPGRRGWVRCFVHTLNLAARALLNQFDTKHSKEASIVEATAQALAEIQVIEKELQDDEDDNAEQGEVHAPWEFDGGDRADDLGVIDEVVNEEDASELYNAVRPVTLTLSKVSTTFGALALRLTPYRPDPQVCLCHSQLPDQTSPQVCRVVHRP